MSARGKVKYVTDYTYVCMLKDGYRKVPTTTTIDGVRIVMQKDGMNATQIDDFLRAVNEGGVYTPRHGPFSRIHRRVTIQELLAESAARIRHDGIYGVCWWHNAKRLVWWVKSERDAAAQVAGQADTDSDESIRRYLMIASRVWRVRIEIEAQPDLRRDRGWEEVYPRRHRHNR